MGLDRVARVEGPNGALEYLQEMAAATSAAWAAWLALVNCAMRGGTITDQDLVCRLIGQTRGLLLHIPQVSGSDNLKNRGFDSFFR
jgi:hypothetical protein